MSDYSWAFFAFALSFTMAFFSESNRHFKLDGFRLNFWRMCMALVILTPITFYIDWPAPSLFYPVAVLAGVVMVISHALRFNMAAKHNGRVATLYMPVQAFLAFFLWVLTDSNSLAQYLEHPIQALVVLACLFAVTGAMFTIRQNDASWQAFLTVAPIGVMFAVMDVLAKTVLMDIDVMRSGVAYILVATSSAVVVSAAFLSMRRHRWRSMTPPGMFKAASVLSVTGLIGFFCFINAVSRAPNPGYVAAVVMLAPVWLMIYHKLTGVKDDASPLSGLIMIIAAIVLVVAYLVLLNLAVVIVLVLLR